MKRSIATIIGLPLVLGLGLFAQGRSAADNKDGNWGTVKGRVVYAGDALPEPKKLDVNKDQDHCLSKGPLYSEELVVNKQNKGVRWAYVWLIPEEGEKFPKDRIHPDLQKVPDKPVEIDQPCCMFVPHAVALREGQVLLAKNSAPIPHNFHWIGHPLKNPGNNVQMTPKSTLPIDNLKADRYPVKVNCDIHGWMSAWVRVFDHPYFAITDEDGKFEIKKAPAGNFRMVSWQEAVGYVAYDKPDDRKRGVPITIKANDVTDVGELKVKPEK
jgi:hypothetical protein